MTNDEILQLAKTCGFDNFQRRKFDGESDYGIQWECWEEQLLKFAQEIYKKAYSTGHRDGYDDGWGGSKVSTEMGTMEFDDE